MTERLRDAEGSLPGGGKERNGRVPGGSPGKPEKKREKQSMTMLGYGLIAVAAICVVVLIILLIRQNSAKKKCGKNGDQPPKSDPGKGSEQRKEKPEPVSPPEEEFTPGPVPDGNGQWNIYAYKPSGVRKVICPKCDAECVVNGEAVLFCEVCGSKLVMRR